MRRPRFYRWIRGRVLQLADTRAFNLRKLAARAQEGLSSDLAAALLLYAHENNCVERLMSFVYDDALRSEFESVERHLGDRSIEKLALRGTPMRSLPDEYRAFLDDYALAYHTPERIAAEKRSLLETVRATMLRTGVSPTELARTLGIDRGNLNAFLTRDEIGRITLEDAQRLVALTTHPAA